MKQENAPVFSAAGQGLAAFYNVDFSVDLTHEIPCAGTWQGDEKVARTLYVDNYNNNFALSITTRTGTFKCPAYSQGNIALSRDDRVTVTSEAYGIVPMTLFTEAKSPGFTARGNPPAAPSDPFLAQLVSLYVIGDNSPTVCAVDSCKNGFGLLTAIPWTDSGTGITYTNAQFAPTRMIFSRGGDGSTFGGSTNRPLGPLVQSTYTATIGKNLTIEFSILISSIPTTSGKKISVIDIGGLTVDLYSIVDGSGNKAVIINGTCGVWLTNINANGNIEYKIAICIIEGKYVGAFVNGNLTMPFQAPVNPIPFPSAASSLIIGEPQSLERPDFMVYLRDIRITNAVRYSQPYDPNIAFYNPAVAH